MFCSPGQNKAYFMDSIHSLDNWVQRKVYVIYLPVQATFGRPSKYEIRSFESARNLVFRRNGPHPVFHLVKHFLNDIFRILCINTSAIYAFLRIKIQLTYSAYKNLVAICDLKINSFLANAVIMQCFCPSHYISSHWVAHHLTHSPLPFLLRRIMRITKVMQKICLCGKVRGINESE